MGKQREINIKTCSDMELKALVFDQLGVRDNASRAIKVLTEELDRRAAGNKDPKVEAKKEEKVPEVDEPKSKKPKK